MEFDDEFFNERYAFITTLQKAIIWTWATDMNYWHDRFTLVLKEARMARGKEDTDLEIFEDYVDNVKGVKEELLQRYEDKRRLL